MGRLASSVDNCLMESFFSTLQRELLGTLQWLTRAELASASFEWIEAWYNPQRRHTSLGDLSPVSTNNSTKPFPSPPTRWHAHHTVRVRETGPGSTIHKERKST